MVKMKILSSILIISYLAAGCVEEVDMKDIFLENREIFKKIENPVKTNKWYVFEKSTFPTTDSIFDSTYLANIEKVFFKTGCNIAYVAHGDVFIGYKGSLSKLLFTSKNKDETIELLNFRGSLDYLLQNGKSGRSPYAIPIAPKWYVVKDLESL